MDKSPISLAVTPPPHLRTADNVRGIYMDLLIALIPTILIGVLSFGYKTAAILLIGAAAAWFFDAALSLCLKHPRHGLPSVLTGLLTAMLLPATVPLWMPLLGSFVGIVLVRELTGGVSKNIFNPAAAAVVFLLLIFPESMNDLPAPKNSLDWFGSAPAFYSNSVSDMAAALIGRNPAVIGAVSPPAILAGWAYLLMRRVSRLHITAACMAVMAAAVLLGGEAALISGSLLFIAVFVAPETVTSPVTTTGKLIFGAGCGLLAVLIHDMGWYADGAGFAVLLMNALVWFFDLKAALWMGKIGGFFGRIRTLFGGKRRAPEDEK